jgi:hypothetical protein
LWLKEKLASLCETLELCDEAGQVLGTFMPLSRREAALRVEPIVGESELRRREQEKGYGIGEVLAHLESL